ncbi:MAG: hypothetical protein ACLR2E_03900 [Lachnospiraceae bacterium]
MYGDELMQAGLVTSDEACGVSDTGVPQGDYQSRVFYLKNSEKDIFPCKAW